MSYQIAAFSNPNNPDFDNIDVKERFSINNTGYYKLDSALTQTNRPSGRYDYHLKYIVHGQGHFIIDGKETAVSARNVLLFHPSEPQIYYFTPADDVKAYWIHFGGTDVPELIRSLELDSVNIIPYNNSTLFTETIEVIYDELTLKKPFHQLKCTSLLTELLIDINRFHKQNSTSPSDTALEAILVYISKNYFRSTSNEEYAAMCNMSTSYFVKMFKNATGTTPQHYKMLYRIERSEKMLIDGSYSISDIASFVGYDDALYFSRIFKKIKGVSPSEYMRAKNNNDFSL